MKDNTTDNCKASSYDDPMRDVSSEELEEQISQMLEKIREASRELARRSTNQVT